jgi:hypothetical protein
MDMKNYLIWFLNKFLLILRKKHERNY